MNAHQRDRSFPPTPAEAERPLDADSPEFIEACLALIEQSAARRRSRLTSEGVESTPAATSREHDVSQQLEESFRQQLNAMRSDHEADVVALSDAHRREADARSALQALQAELSDIKSREANSRTELELVQAELSDVRRHYSETLGVLEATSRRANQAGDEVADAITEITDRDQTIALLRRMLADRDREIRELQQHLIQAEEARITDAAAILDSLHING